MNKELIEAVCRIEPVMRTPTKKKNGQQTCQGIQHNKAQHDNTQHSNTQHNSTRHKDTQHKDAGHNKAQHEDIYVKRHSACL